MTGERKCVKCMRVFWSWEAREECYSCRPEPVNAFESYVVAWTRREREARAARERGMVVARAAMALESNLMARRLGWWPRVVGTILRALSALGW